MVKRSILIAAAIVLAILFVALQCLGYRQRGPSRSRPEAEIKALQTALESYKVDHGQYPSNPATSDRLRPDKDFSSESYVGSSVLLYSALVTGEKLYFEPSKGMLKTNSSGQAYFVDPWGHSYGYSTCNLTNLVTTNASGKGFFDLWSTGGRATQPDQSKWIKNW